MTTTEILNILQQDIHSAVFATVDENGLPQTCVIDLMLLDENGLYFLTAKGKSFYERLVNRGYAAISGMKGQDTRSTISVSLRGKVKSVRRNVSANKFPGRLTAAAACTAETASAFVR